MIEGRDEASSGAGKPGAVIKAGSVGLETWVVVRLKVFWEGMSDLEGEGVGSLGEGACWEVLIEGRNLV